MFFLTKGERVECVGLFWNEPVEQMKDWGTLLIAKYYMQRIEYWK